MRNRLSVRRLVPLAAILAIPLGAYTQASASPVRPTAMSKAVSSELTQLKNARRLQVGSIMRGLRSSHTHSLRQVAGMGGRAGQAPLTHRNVTSHAKSNTSGLDLALPSSVLAAGNGTQGPVSSGVGPFKVLHSTWTGFSSGVAASFNFEPILDLFYQGSVFTDAASAQAYMNDSYTHLASGSSVPPSDCSSSVGYPCKIVGYVTTSGLVAVYSVAQINYCVIEAGYQGDGTQINANLDTASKAIAGVFTEGISEAVTACTSASPGPQATAQPTPHPTQVPTQVSTSLHVVGCFQKSGTKPSASPACRHTAKRGHKILLIIYTTVESAPVGSSAEVTATVKRGSTTVRTGSGSFSTQAGIDLYYVGGPWTLPKKKATYTLHVQTTMNGVTASDDETLKVS